MFSKVSLKAFVFSPCCILVRVPECLLVGKFGHWGPRIELSGWNEVLRRVIFPWEL